MARKKWSDEARKRQSKAIKKMWAEKKKAKVNPAPITPKKTLPKPRSTSQTKIYQLYETMSTREAKAK